MKTIFHWHQFSACMGFINVGIHTCFWSRGCQTANSKKKKKHKANDVKRADLTMTKSADNLAVLLRITILLSLPNEALSSSSEQYSRVPLSKPLLIDVRQMQSNRPRTTASVIAVVGRSSRERLGDFARLNAMNKYGGHLTRDSIHEAVAQMKMQQPSHDIVIFGVASLN